MRKRLQVTLDGAELREIRRIAQSRHMSVAAWAREALRYAMAGAERDSVKLAVIRTAARHRFPIGDMGDALEHPRLRISRKPRRIDEIERREAHASRRSR